MSGGKKYLVNTSFVFECDNMPVVPEYYYNYIYDVTLHDIDQHFYDNSLSDDVCSALFTMSVQSANSTFQDNYVLELPYLPPFPSIYPNPPYKVDIKQYEKFNLNATITDFIKRRVVFNRYNSQSYVNIKKNFITYLIDTGYTQSHTLSDYLSDDIFSKVFPEILATFNMWFDAKAQGSITEGKRGRDYNEDRDSD